MKKQTINKHTHKNQLVEFRKLTPEQLIKKRDETTKLLLGCTSGGLIEKPVTNPSNRSNIRMTIARINTVLGEKGVRHKMVKRI